MLFNSFNFIIFFILVTTFYFILPNKFRWFLLLVASLIFYMAWNPFLIILIMLTIVTNYIASLKLAKSDNRKFRKQMLALCMVFNFGLLFVFKYLGFINDTFITIFGESWPIGNINIILPMGISFYTFQATAYTIDVYRGDIEAEKHFGIFTLFIMFFPQLVAGPIERSKNLLPQFRNEYKFDFPRVISGVRIMFWGFFKKIVIADRASIAVDTIYNSITDYKGLYLALATVLFSFQIYCDFSGYSDIAKGAARVLGYDLMDNFKNPYLSKSIKEFWRRWHISLSTWFMDYVYFPLGGNREGDFKKYRNLMITFLISGLWHGANWTFVLWGALHGVYQVVGQITLPFRDKIKKKLHIEKISGIFSIIITFGLVTLGLAIFRANTLSDAFYVFQNIGAAFTGWWDKQYIFEVLTGMGLNLYEMLVVIGSIFILMFSEMFCKDKSVYDVVEGRGMFLRLVFYFIVAVIILSAGVFYNAGAFIYFQF